MVKNDTLIWMKNLDGDLGATVTVSFLMEVQFLNQVQD